MATTTPPTPAGAIPIKPGPEGVQYPTPTQGLANWTKEMTQTTPQAGLL